MTGVRCIASEVKERGREREEEMEIEKGKEAGKSFMDGNRVPRVSTGTSDSPFVYCSRSANEFKNLAIKRANEFSIKLFGSKLGLSDYRFGSTEIE